MNKNGKKTRGSVGLRHANVELKPTGKEQVGDKVNITEYKIKVPNPQPKKKK